MRKVTITYTNGNQCTYETIKIAAQNAGCNPQTLLRMSTGVSATYTMRHLGISKVYIDANKGDKNSHRRKEHHPLRCTNEVTGEVIETKTIREAQRLTGNEAHNLSYIIGDGQYHWGWKYELKEEDKYSYPNPVPADVIQLIYRYAKAYTCQWRLHWDLAKEIVQEIACHVSSEYSKGKYNAMHSIKAWVWWECKYFGNRIIKKEINYSYRIAEPPEDAEWDDLIGREDDSMRTQEMLNDMPSELRLIAQLYLDGKDSRLELNANLGMKDAQRRALTEKLIKWLKDRQNGS